MALIERLTPAPRKLQRRGPVAGRGGGGLASLAAQAPSLERQHLRRLYALRADDPDQLVNRIDLRAPSRSDVERSPQSLKSAAIAIASPYLGRPARRSCAETCTQEAR
jgi:hypothetical protein